ncbi:MAG: hypothetical protein K6L80_12695 [Agarilytica sp.]
MKLIHHLSASILLLSSASTFAGSCEVLQSATMTIAENNQSGHPPATAIIGGRMDLAPLTGSDFSRDVDPVVLYLDGVKLQENSLASLDDIHWWTTELVQFGTADIKNFRVVMNFNDGSTIECDSDIEVRYEDADPIVNQLRFDVLEVANGIEVNVRATMLDTDGAAQLEAQYELVRGPSTSLPAANTVYNAANPIELIITDQKLTFTEAGEYELRIRVTDENGNTNVSESVSFEVEGGCITSSNADHVSAGRANNYFGFAYAAGSAAWLGYTAFGSSTLEELWPGYWLPTTSCN